MDFRSSFQNVNGQPSYSPASATNSSPHQQGLLGMQSPMSFNRSFQNSTLDRLLQPSNSSSMGAGMQGAEGQGVLGMDGSYSRQSHQQQQQQSYGQPGMSVRRSSHMSTERSGQQMSHQVHIGGNDNGPSSSAVKEDPAAATTGKRGSKACVACRKGKNRCEADPTGKTETCRRCLINGTPCVFEKPADRTGKGRPSAQSETMDQEGRVSSLERSVHDLAHGQNQIQNALAQLLSMMPQSSSYLQHDGAVPTANIFTSVSPPSAFGTSSLTNRSPAVNPPMAVPQADKAREFPKLPGFKPPNHQWGTYGVIPLSSAPGSPALSRHSRSSSSHSAVSESGLPHGSLIAPIQALEALANAAKKAAGDDADGEDYDDGKGKTRKRKRVRMDGNVSFRVKKQTKPDPTPRNPFPDVVTKGLVGELESRQLWDIFFSGCHLFVPLWDRSYDTYDSYIERTPFSTNGLLAVAAKIRAGNGPLDVTFHRCLEEAQGIARSTLFGPIVRKEAAMAMLILSVWSPNSWLPCGHALRMSLDMNLHKALDKLADASIPRTDAEERDLVVSARIWLNCYVHDHLLGCGKPLLLRDESSSRRARILLNHAMASDTDVRLVASVELANIRVRVFEHLTPLHGRVDSQTLSFVRRTFSDLLEWHREWHHTHRQKFDEEHVLVKLLEAELVHAQLWTVCVALRGVRWDSLPSDQRELALQAKDAALRCLEIYLRSQNFRAHLKYATHDQLVSVAFAAVFLLKIALLYPDSLSLSNLISQVSEVAHMLSNECFAERYALTLRLMLAGLRRKTGALSTVPGTPHGQPQAGGTLPTTASNTVGGSGMMSDAFGQLSGGLDSLLSLPQMGEAFDTLEAQAQAQGQGDGMFGGGDLMDFSWPTEFSPSNLPVWLQDGNFADLGLPVDGSDSLFLPPELANMFLPSGNGSLGSFALPDSAADGGAEAW